MTGNRAGLATRAGIISTMMLMWLWPQTQAMADGVSKPSELVRLEHIDPSIVQEIRYAGHDNFMGTPVDGYQVGRCWLTPAAARGLKAAQAALAKRGLGLKVFDCYRPQRAVDHFVRWARDAKQTQKKSIYYPAVPKARLFDDGYIAARSGHSRGSTVDLTIVRGPRPMPQTAYDCRHPKHWGDELPMGTAYDCFDPLSHTDDARIDPKAQANRRLLRAVMVQHGFTNYSKEWWHYTLVNEPYPQRYFDQPIK